MRTPQFAAGLPDRLGGRDSGLVFELFQHAGVVFGQRCDAVSRLVGDEREAPAFPEEKGHERAAEAADAEVLAPEGIRSPARGLPGGQVRLCAALYERAEAAECAPHNAG